MSRASCARDLELLGGGQAGAGRLLAVAQRGVEDADAARRDARPRRAGVIVALTWACAGRSLADAWAWPASTTTGSRNGIWPRSSRADPLDLVVAVARAQPLELAGRRARSRRSSGPANVPSWMSREDLLHRRRGRARR